MKLLCLAAAAIAVCAEPKLPYVDTAQDQLLAKAGDITIMAGENDATGIMMNDDGLTFKVASVNYKLADLKQIISDATDDRVNIASNANSDVPGARANFQTAINNLDNSLEREQQVLSALVQSVSNTYTAVSNDASTLLSEMTQFDAVLSNGDLGPLSNNVASFDSTAASMVASLDASLTAKVAEMSTAASDLSTELSNKENSIDQQMTSIETAVAGLPDRENTTMMALASMTANFANASFLAIQSAEVARANQSDGTLNAFIAARTTADAQISSIESIDTTVKSAFSGRYTNIFTTSRNLLEGKYGGTVEVDVTPAEIKAISGADYGRDCAAAGEYMACGAEDYRSTTSTASVRGGVVVYKVDAATQSATMVQILDGMEVSPGRNPDFGGSVDMHGEWLVVGADYYTSTTTSSTLLYQGAAFLYRRGSDGKYTLASRMVNPKGVRLDYCGRSVAVSNTHVAFSCPGYDAPYGTGTLTRSSHGIIHVYRINTRGLTVTTTLEASLTHPVELATSDQMGATPDAISLSGNTLVGGIEWYDGPTRTTYSTGAVAVFEYANNAWSRSAFIMNPASTATSTTLGRYDYFGTAVDIIGDMMVVTAPGHDINTTVGGATASGVGSAYVFTRNSSKVWSLQQRVTRPGGNAFDSLGEGVAINEDGTQFAVSAHATDAAGSSAGSVLVFSKTATGQFKFEREVTHSDAASFDYFGYGVDFGKDFFVAGAYAAEDVGFGSTHGKAYVFIDYELFPSA